jgi:prepilin-type N-terminal cleavage/methylation domain-containing protein
MFKNQSGFTLIELTVVLFIVAMLLGGLLSPLSQRIEQADRANTQIALDDIEEALYGFALTNGRMVCPDCMNNNGTCAGFAANDGQEDPTPGGSCAASVPILAPPFPNPNAPATTINISTGNLPWATLSVPQSDAWGNPFTYSVSTETADAIASNTVTPTVSTLGAACATFPAQSSIALCSAGSMVIQGVCGTPANAIAEEVVAVVVSHGANATRIAGLVAAPTAATCLELENHINDNDGSYVFTNYADPNSGTAASFDDMIIWVSPNILKNRLISAGRLP